MNTGIGKMDDIALHPALGLGEDWNLVSCCW